MKSETILSDALKRKIQEDYNSIQTFNEHTMVNLAAKYGITLDVLLDNIRL